ncbi:7-cyano-7-deazaguanine synthase [Candidatus Woesearchaeota archaeon]|nr:7-cyano-7-deazaguanine synthase [Candidatus Woesearchaeota archaeon]MBW3005897.1 7-cyano-7-deazaguanine synthase [Candidatus Woesearchaeota archaeon]
MKVISLLSGGIDSAVSSYLMLKKGADVVFVHFHNQTLQKKYVENKVVKTAKILSNFTKKKTQLYLVPFKQLQQEIIKAVPARYRMIVYRRVMFKIAEEILKKEKAKGLVTGDSLGQVASQTLDNLQVLYDAAKKPVLTPLLGMDKVDIINIAKEIKTFETSILPYSDCCSFLIAKHPETKAKLEKIKEMESKLDLQKLIKETLEKAKIIPLP